MRFTSLSAAALLMVAALSANAQTDGQRKFRRSSVYSVLVHSNTMDQKLNESKSTGNVLLDVVRSAKGADLKSVSPTVVTDLFPTIAIPRQFNDFNLSTRVVEYDGFNITEADITAADEATGKKKKGIGALAGKALSTATGGMTMPTAPGNDDVTKGLKALAIKFFEQNHVADSLVAKWYNYQGDKANEGSHYDLGVIQDLGIRSISAEDKRKFEAGAQANSDIINDAVKLMDHTYVMLNYFKYRANADILAEYQAYADALGSMGGMYGQIASQALGAVAGTIAGDGYSVQTNTYLYRLDWNDEVNNKFYDQCWKGSFEDLVKSGICKLTYVGHEKSRAGVRTGIASKANADSLIVRAVQRSLDENIARLQAEFEDFRTLTPVLGVDTEKGEIYAEIGLRENVLPGDEYELLQYDEAKDDYKSIGKFKPVEGQIYNNCADAADEIAEDLASSDAKKKAAAEAMQGLTKTTFKGGKVKEEYAGCLLRLVKKAKGMKK